MTFSWSAAAMSFGYTWWLLCFSFDTTRATVHGQSPATACFLGVPDPDFLAVLLTAWCWCLLFKRPCAWLFDRAVWLLALPIETDISLPFCCRSLRLSSLFTPTTTQLIWWKWDVKMPQASVTYPVSLKKLWLPPEIFVPSSNWLFLLLTFRQLQQVSPRLPKDS